jgi:hypothetical protein
MFINTDSSGEGMHGLDVARARLFFSFKYRDQVYPCALVQWYCCIGDEPERDTGMWVVKPETNADGSSRMAIIHLDTIIRGAHLIGVYGDQYIPTNLTFNDSLNAFYSFYVNKFIDNHASEIAF